MSTFFSRYPRFFIQLLNDILTPMSLYASERRGEPPPQERTNTYTPSPHLHPFAPTSPCFNGTPVVSRRDEVTRDTTHVFVRPRQDGHDDEDEAALGLRWLEVVHLRVEEPQLSVSPERSAWEVGLAVGMGWGWGGCGWG